MVKSGSGFNGLNLMCFVSLMIVQGGEQWTMLTQNSCPDFVFCVRWARWVSCCKNSILWDVQFWNHSFLTLPLIHSFEWIFQRFHPSGPLDWSHSTRHHQPSKLHILQSCCPSGLVSGLVCAFPSVHQALHPTTHPEQFCMQIAPKLRSERFWTQAHRSVKFQTRAHMCHGFLLQSNQTHGQCPWLVNCLCVLTPPADGGVNEGVNDSWSGGSFSSKMMMNQQTEPEWCCSCWCSFVSFTLHALWRETSHKFLRMEVPVLFTIWLFHNLWTVNTSNGLVLNLIFVESMPTKAMHVLRSSSWCLLHWIAQKFCICNHSETMLCTLFVTNSLSFHICFQFIQWAHNSKWHQCQKVLIKTVCTSCLQINANSPHCHKATVNKWCWQCWPCLIA